MRQKCSVLYFFFSLIMNVAEWPYNGDSGIIVKINWNESKNEKNFKIEIVRDFFQYEWEKKMARVGIHNIIQTFILSIWCVHTLNSVYIYSPHTQKHAINESWTVSIRISYDILFRINNIWMLRISCLYLNTIYTSTSTIDKSNFTTFCVRV